MSVVVDIAALLAIPIVAWVAIESTIRIIDLRLAPDRGLIMSKFEDLQAQEAATSASVVTLVATLEKVLASQQATAAQLTDAQSALASLQAQVQAMGGVDPAKYDAMTADLAALKAKVDAAVAQTEPPPAA